ncbi:hypothetical protein IWW56_003272 [Coemansia sp. RSA 2131]|nr:hypothetical protein IWW56_003272 [Coemansia sp. RSA 2131]
MLATRQTPVLAALRRSTEQAARAMCAFGSTARSQQKTPILLHQFAASAMNCAIKLQKYSYATSIRSTPKSPQCPTCGAAFQTENSGAPGYLNEQKWWQMNQANVVKGLPEIEGSLISHLGNIIGAQHPVVLAENKADLLPKDYHEQCLLMWFKCFAKSLKLNIQAIHLVLALKNLGVCELAADLMWHRPRQNIYMVGCANVGKSELINALLRISIGGSAHKVLASH